MTRYSSVVKREWLCTKVFCFYLFILLFSNNCKGGMCEFISKGIIFKNQ